MRVLFATWAAPGHFFPMVPLAWACRAAGLEAVVAVPPGCRAAVEGAGLTAVEVGPAEGPPDKGPVGNVRSWGSDRPWAPGWTARPELLDDWQTTVLDYTAGKQVTAAERTVDDLVRFARWWRPDLVVGDSLCFAAPVAAAAVGVPNVATGWEVATVLGAERAGRRGDWLPGYAELFERFGAEPRACAHTVVETSPPALRIPESFPVRRVPMRYVPFNGAGTAPSWLGDRPRRPRVCVTAGVALGEYDATTAVEVTRRLAESVSGLGLDLVIAAGRRAAEQLTGLPEGTRFAEGVPFHLLLPTCAAVIHHGGAGTALTAVDAGIPQLILPQSPMYAEIGHRIQRAGVGAVAAADSTPEHVGAALAELLDDQRYTEGLAGVRAEMSAMPAPSEVVHELKALAGASRSQEGEPCRTATR
ncbi:nucleotide disphospho-sugar-binding domain-containing protein [Kitasatospora sp. NPDC101157]|uniref:nucleotide disphospho-sugar-binding domain-containing protein n=1 Tax=Kitasatospora sp. NPDC101157 TaxID=3364098 RepID=UPI003811586C